MRFDIYFSINHLCRSLQHWKRLLQPNFQWIPLLLIKNLHQGGPLVLFSKHGWSAFQIVGQCISLNLSYRLFAKAKIIATIFGWKKPFKNLSLKLIVLPQILSMLIKIIVNYLRLGHRLYCFLKQTRGYWIKHLLFRRCFFLFVVFVLLSWWIHTRKWISNIYTLMIYAFQCWRNVHL